MFCETFLFGSLGNFLTYIPTMWFLDTEHDMLTLYFALMEQSNLNDADVLNKQLCCIERFYFKARGTLFGSFNDEH